MKEYHEFVTEIAAERFIVWRDNFSEQFGKRGTDWDYVVFSVNDTTDHAVYFIRLGFSTEQEALLARLML